MADPEEMGFCRERLDRVGLSMQKYIDAGMVPGTLTLIARHGRVVHLEARGLMDVEAGKALRPDTIFRIMSMTKPVTAVALMMLYEEGHFLLTDPISAWLPCMENMKVRGPNGRIVPAERPINFRDCLTHTAGFSMQELQNIQARLHRPAPGSGSDSNYTPALFVTAEQIVEELAKAPLNSQPGAMWEYHPGYEVAGVLVEKVSGHTLEQFFQERILGPLQMVDTHFYLPEEKLPRFAAGYRVNLKDGGRFGLCDPAATSAKVIGPRVFFSGGGGLLSTAADYARFAQAILNGGELDGVRLLGRKTVELMTVNHTGDLDLYPRGPGYGYGLGFSVRKDLSGDPAVGSIGAYGWGGAYCTRYLADPVEDLFGLMFTQVSNFRDNPALTIREDFERMGYQALVGK